ncbi:phage tail protein [Mergibacter septicus]|uniref:phage tail protein n=1 Tax=Mergibacter septicus TaxID=221402 RepID=UPI0021C43430|nr:phage tail protein [Mergibacter septicus]UTU48067.1 tail fiber protein [Mergibacter septicus]WMR96321.1 phage tail protein [Mergibacter septicus]
MANLQVSPSWETGIYQIETSDPVVGGENGIANRQAKQLAARTLYLKQQLETLANKRASTTQIGQVQLTNATDSNSETLALTAKAGKTLAEQILQVSRAIPTQYTPTAATTTQAGIVQLSNETNSNAENKAPTLKALKSLNTKIEGRILDADSSQNVRPYSIPANGKSQFYRSAGYEKPSDLQQAHNYGCGIAIRTGATNSGFADIYIPHTANGNAEFWVRNGYQGFAHSNWTVFKPLPPITSVVNDNSENKIATARGVKTAYDKAVEALNKANESQFTQNLAQNGWCRMPNGLILQWGFLSKSSLSGSYATVTFPISFTEIFNISLTAAARGVDGDNSHYIDTGVHNLTNQSFRVFSWWNGGNFDGFYWTAIGK